MSTTTWGTLSICVLKMLILDVSLVLGIDFGDFRKTRTHVELGAMKYSGTTTISATVFKDARSYMTCDTTSGLLASNASLGSSYPPANLTVFDITSWPFLRVGAEETIAVQTSSS